MMRVGVAVSHFLQLLVEFHPVQLFLRKGELSPESLLVCETGVQVWSGSKTQQVHQQPTCPILVALAVAGHECPMPTLHHAIGLRMIDGACDMVDSDRLAKGGPL